MVATLPGTRLPPRERMLRGQRPLRFAQHRHHRCGGDAPGANDDASGTAAVMELACVMAARFDATIVFMAVAGRGAGFARRGPLAREKAKQQRPRSPACSPTTSSAVHAATIGQRDAAGAPVRRGHPAPSSELTETIAHLLATGGENDSLRASWPAMSRQLGERYLPGFTVTVIQRRDRYLRGGDHIPSSSAASRPCASPSRLRISTHQHQNLRTEGGHSSATCRNLTTMLTSPRWPVNAASWPRSALAPAAPQPVQLRTAKLNNDY